MPAPGSHPWRSGQRCPHSPGPGPPSRPPAGNRGPAVDPAGARRRWGLPGRYRVIITVRHSREGVCGGGWGVKKANLSPYSLTDPAKPLRTPGPPGGWRKVARGSLDPPLRLCKVSAGAKARVYKHCYSYDFVYVFRYYICLGTEIQLGFYI